MMNAGSDAKAIEEVSMAFSDMDDKHSEPQEGNETDIPAREAGVPSPQEKIDKQETRAISRLRLIVIAVLVVSTTAVATGVHYYLKNSEETHFEDTFHTDADKIINCIAEDFTRMLSASDGLSVNLVSYAKYSNSTWPQSTLPDFAVQATKALKQAPILYYSIYTLVQNSEREAWEKYSLENDAWVLEAFAAQAKDDTYHGYTPSPEEYEPYGVIFGTFDDRPHNESLYLPIWQTHPVTSGAAPFNWDLYDATNTMSIDSVLKTKRVTLSEAYMLPDPADPEQVAEAESFAEWFSGYMDEGEDPSEPVSDVYYPILDGITDNVRGSESEDNELVGILAMSFYWGHLLKEVLLPEKEGFVVVFESPCNPTFSYEVNGGNSTFLGRGDHHDTGFDRMEFSARLVDTGIYKTFSVGYTGVPLDEDFCPHTIRIYPTTVMRDSFYSASPIIFAVIAGLIFLQSSGVFLVYDCLVEKRQNKTMRSAVRSKALVTSLFPSSVHDRLFKEAQANEEMMRLEAPNTTRLRHFLDGEDDSHDDLDNEDNVFVYKTKPIADLFPETTIMFADLVGFTAWSSAREPTQVFILLETIYKAFDDIASRRRVFKVETVGDCYVAVCGLPDPRKDHAVVMSRFASDCMRRMCVLVKKLEEVLGPDTAELSMRFGCHSGPVTGGVLRGERSRFQLFGDTMNTSSRMETTSLPGKIQLSKETAELLVEAGRKRWLEPRKDKVTVKGKGEMETFWLTKDGDHTSAPDDSSRGFMSFGEGDVAVSAEKESRLIKWLVDVLASLLKQIQSKRKARGFDSPEVLPEIVRQAGVTVLDEIQEVIHLPSFDGVTIADSNTIQLDSEVEDQLNQYVSSIADLYRDNPFHNFEHASHVTMSVVKLMSRIVAPDLKTESCKAGEVASRLHDHTYGITSDPLTQFACAFSALIHDVDHSGVPNTQLLVSNPELSELYNRRSVAEQHSVDVSWELLMEDRFAQLRQAIYHNKSSQKRFRQLVVNSVMATDIMDKDLKVLRNRRWDDAFFEQPNESEPTTTAVNRKATIVIEHLIQASDVAHTMQHWHVYRKWNERLFHEMYKAFREGRSDKDPSLFWYEGELGFFDFYILPLAKKLQDCGVFGVSSAEYLSYAKKNREEFALRGREAVAEMTEEFNLLEQDLVTGASTSEEDPDKVSPEQDLDTTCAFHGTTKSSHSCPVPLPTAGMPERVCAMPGSS